MTELNIHTRTAAEPGLFVNSYLLENADGVVLVDAGLLVEGSMAAGPRPLAGKLAGVPLYPGHGSPCGTSLPGSQRQFLQC